MNRQPEIMIERADGYKKVRIDRNIYRVTMADGTIILEFYDHGGLIAQISSDGKLWKHLYASIYKYDAVLSIDEFKNLDMALTAISKCKLKLLNY